MNGATTVLGADPGATTGLCMMQLKDATILHCHVVQCDASSAGMMLRALLGEAIALVLGNGDRVSPRLAIEAFQRGTSRHAGRSGRHGRRTTELVEELATVGTEEHAVVLTRAAGTVKPWASDERLEAAGLLAATKGMGHARDAVRHALYEAVHSGLLRDPLEGTL